MSDIAIRVENLSKQYTIGHAQQRHDTLRDALAGIFHRNGSNNSTETFWALKDVSFEVKRGEVVGIIGRNGAGKSTLLKILSQITEPTSGRAEIHGRVSSLLEVGTGFHPELTGRENIYLNGAILGMRREEIARRFDEIVAFAEIEKFLDTPVKRYSSGMYVRLAFAVAAHLEPEILLVDEVLAVGDAAFQKKCLGKMGDVAKKGRTVLFVSHNMAAVQALCTCGIYLRNGEVYSNEIISRTVSTYLGTLEQLASHGIEDRSDRGGKGAVRLTDLEIRTETDTPLNTLATGMPACFIFHVSNPQPGLACTFTVYDHQGQAIATFPSATHSPDDLYLSELATTLICELDELLLVPGRYRMNVSLTSNGELQDHVEAAAFFNVEPGHIHGRPVAAEGRYGSVHLPHRWQIPSW